jgi:hypothetical protein
LISPICPPPQSLLGSCVPAHSVLVHFSLYFRICSVSLRPCPAPSTCYCCCSSPLVLLHCLPARSCLFGSLSPPPCSPVVSDLPTTTTNTKRKVSSPLPSPHSLTHSPTHSCRVRSLPLLATTSCCCYSWICLTFACSVLLRGPTLLRTTSTGPTTAAHTATISDTAATTIIYHSGNNC